MRTISYWSVVLLLSIVVHAEVVTAAAARGEDSTKTSSPTEPENKSAKKPPSNRPSFNAEGHTDWGSYYDPQNEFCGNYDCYKILGFDYEDYENPDKKEITQRYRSLSRAWHPDKSKHKDAKERFVKIARAYEVLTNEKTRKEYDFLRYNQEAYVKKYGSSVMWAYAPKTNTVMVIFFLLATGSVLSWFIQMQQWRNVADKLIRASVEDWGSGQGGTPESKDLRARAIKILEEREAESTAASPTGSGDEDAASASKKKKKLKLTATEKRKQQEESLRPIIAELVEEIEDFGAGYHKPTWRDLLVVKLAQFPYTFSHAILWNLMYFVRRIRNLELNEEEREVLTKRAVGPINWESADEEERKKMIMKDLWVSENMAEWEEEQEMRLWSNTDRKRYMRMKKRGGPKEE